jgi:tellurite resistance protein TerC
MNELVPVAALVLCLFAFLWIDLKLFPSDREPTFRAAAAWSIGWLVVSLLAALVVWAVQGPDDAVLYTTVYFVERSLSLDNLFVFLLLFRYFAVPVPQRARLLFWGIVAALALRGLAILGGVALIEQFHFVVYVLGATLLLLAYRIFRGVEEGFDPAHNLFVRGMRRVFPVTDSYHDKSWFLRIRGRTHVTPLFLCLGAIVFADIAFAIDSIPAAFGITRDPFLIWMGNVFALVGLRALFVLVEGLIKRFRYLDETIAIVLGAVAVKLLIEDVYKMPALGSLALVLGLLAGGMIVSLIAEWHDARQGKPPGAGTPQARLTPDEDPQLRHD